MEDTVSQLLRLSAIALAAALVIPTGMGAAEGTAPSQGTPASQATPANLDEYIKMVRTDVQNGKAQVIGATLELSATEAAAFWPVYKRYEADLSAIHDERYAAIKDYAANYASLTDAKATELADRALGLEEKRLSLVRKYLGEFRSVLTPKKAARWYQTEMALNKLIDLRIAAELPLVR